MLEDEPAGESNGNAHREIPVQHNITARRTITQEQRPEPARPGAQALAACLYCAIDAAIAGEQYAREKSLPLKLTSDDIRAMAISLHIDSRKEAR